MAIGFTGAAVMAVSVSAQTYLSMMNHGHSFGRILLWQLSGWVAWVGVMPLALGQGTRLAASGLHPRRILVVALSGLAFTGVHVLLTSQFTVWLQPYLPMETYTFDDALKNQGRSRLVIDVLDYVILVLVGYAGAVYHRARSLEVRESMLEADLAHAQLDALRLEIEPHFLFNTLNSIASLIRDCASDRALTMLLGLSDLMRATLDASIEHTTTLGSELTFVKRYIDLQSVRFSDRLVVRYLIAHDCEGCAVPTFMLQPLVENAFRHGIAKQSGACHLELVARLEGGHLHLWVNDDGAGLPDGFRVHEQPGVGLRNAIARLKRLFGEGGSLDIGPGEQGGTTVHIVVPVGTNAALPTLPLQAAG